MSSPASTPASAWPGGSALPTVTLDRSVLHPTISLLNHLLAMSTTQNSLLFSVRNSDNSAGTQEVALPGAGIYLLNVDANNNVTFSAAPTVNPTRVETLALDATATVGTVKTITLATPMPDANYEITIIMRGLPGGVQEVPGSKTASSFQVKVTAVIVGTIAFALIHDLA